nr:hypothetical protein [Tanacetum cinerariifolium]
MTGTRNNIQFSTSDPYPKAVTRVFCCVGHGVASTNEDCSSDLDVIADNITVNSVKIRIQFRDSICELNKKDDCDNGTDNVDNEAYGSVVREKDGVVEEDRHSPMKNNNQG